MKNCLLTLGLLALCSIPPFFEAAANPFIEYKEVVILEPAGGGGANCTPYYRYTYRYQNGVLISVDVDYVCF